MIKTLFLYILMFSVFVSCFEESEETPGGGLFKNHKQVENSFTISLPNNKVYKEGETLAFTLTHAFTLTVTGSPQLQLTIGSSSVNASYTSGSGSNKITFEYTVQANDEDTDGISINPTLSLNGGLITFQDNGVTTLADGSSIDIADTSNILVDAVSPSVSSITPPVATTYYTNQSLYFYVNYDETVEVTGNPRLQIDIGGTTTYANYLSGSGTSQLIFSYTITSPDLDNDGIQMSSPLDLNGGSINDNSGNLSDLSFSPVSMATTYVDSDTPLVTAITYPTNETYLSGDFIELKLHFTETVNIVGIPRVQFDLGGVTKYFNYQSGTGTAELTFRYLVVPGDDDESGISITNSIDLNSGSIQDVSANNSLLNLNISLTPGVIVDAGIPEVQSITAPTNGTYLTSETLSFTLNYDKVVNVTGSPRLAIETTTSSPGYIYANYLSGSGTQNLVFQYVVSNGDSDLNGIEIQNAIDLNGGSIIGANTVTSDTDITTAVAATNTSSILIDAREATITNVTGPSDNTYITGNDLDFTITFDKAVTVANSPRISLDIGGVTRYATYLSGSGSQNLVFRYSIVVTDTDSDGIQISSSSIDLNSTGIIQDSLPAYANLDMTGLIPDLSGVIVYQAPVTINSVTPPTDQTYFEGDTLSFTLNISENVNVTGTPRITIDIGGTNKYATYQSGTGSAALVFSYTIEADLQDTDGISLISPLDFNGGTIQNSSLDNLGIGFTTPSMTAVLVDSIDPIITSISTPTTATYIAGQNLDFIVNTDENITITGTPQVQLDIGGVTKYADYISGSGTTALTFRYTVEAGLLDNDGITIFSPIVINSATLQNSVAQNLDLIYTIPSLLGVLVDSDIPEITSITPPSDSTYTETQSLDFTVNIDEVVTVTGTPRLQLNIGGVTKYATFTGGSGSSALTFSYVVESSLEDTDGIQLISPLDLNGATIQNGDSESLDLAFTPPSMPNVFVNSSPPTIAITTPVDSSYINSINDSTTYTISGTCSENGQTVSIEVNSSPAANPIGFLCDGTNFTGTIDTTALAQAAHTIDASILDTFSNQGNATTINVTKESILPEVNSSTGPAATYHLAGANLDFTLATSEVVNVTGTPRIQLNINGITRDAIYTSGTGTNSIVFRYTVTAEEDLDGLAYISTNLDLNGGSVTDNAGNPINIDLELNASLPNLTSVFVDGIAPTVTISSSPNITSANETTYVASGTCSDNGRTVNISIGTINLTPTCNSNAWSVGPLDTSSLADNASISFTANHTDLAGNNATQASINISKDTATPMVAITNAPNIDVSNHTAYTVSGTCTDNGLIVDVNIGTINIQPNCSGGTWSTGNVDVSSLADNPTLAITADHNSATQASTTVDKNTTSSVVTISSAPNITGANELTYIASGTCSDNGIMVDINIGSINTQPTCSSGSWSTGQIDVSSLADSGSISFTADHNGANQVSFTISKNTATPTVSSLSSPTTLTTSVDLSWNLNDPGGFVINDYEINYRIKSTSTWLSFSDGVSTNTTGSVTGLSASTTYEFRTRVQYDTSNYSDWSNIAEAETKPDNPLFSSPYAAMNVGGATSTSVTAYYDNTAVTLNGTPIAASPLSKGQVVTITTAQFDVLDGDKPIFAAGLLGSGNGGSGANMVWMPTSWAGKSFSFNATRANPQNLFVYATENATVTVKQGSTTLDTITLTAGNGGTLNWSVYGSYQVSSTGTILAYHMSGSGNTRYDPKPILPGYTEIIGFPSASMRLTADFDATNYNLIHSNSVVASGNLNRQDVITVTPEGTSSLYQSHSLLITADRNVSGASFADSNGLCAAPFLPTNLLKTKYITNARADYVAFASKTAGTIDVYDSTQTIGVDTPIETLTLTRTGANANAPYKVRRGGTTPAGYRFVATVPVAAWYHPNEQAGSAERDETILYGTND